MKGGILRAVSPTVIDALRQLDPVVLLASATGVGLGLGLLLGWLVARARATRAETQLEERSRRVADIETERDQARQDIGALREQLSALRAQQAGLTAQAEAEQRLEGLEGGADDYIVKPFEMRELDVRVRNLIASRRRLRERFSALSHADSPDDSGLAPVDRAYATRIRDAIRSSMTDPAFGVTELADAIAQDRSHMVRRVKEVFGESPSDVIRRMRLEEGARLLSEGSATVSDVAYAVGFNSLSHFCRRFIEVYGVTPATYRTALSFRAKARSRGVEE
jgi:AraC-like DNA-binding protein